MGSSCCGGKKNAGNETNKSENPKEVKPQEQKNTNPDPIPQPEPESRELTKEDKIKQENMEMMTQNKWSENQVNAVREVFNKFDKDGSGEIGKKELKACSNECGEDLSKQELNFLMGEWDENDDGNINFKEFCMMLK